MKMLTNHLGMLYNKGLLNYKHLKIQKNQIYSAGVPKVDNAEEPIQKVKIPIINLVMLKQRKDLEDSFASLISLNNTRLL